MKKMKKNYISPEVEVMKTQPAAIIATSLLDAAGTDLREDITIDDPDFIQVKSDVLGEDLEW